MLDRQTIEMPLAQGVDTKTDPKQVVAGKLLRLENGVFTKLKSIQKRNGNIALGKTVINETASVVSDGLGLATYNNELLLSGSDQIYSYEAGTDGWVNKGLYVPIDLTKRSILKDTYEQRTPDSATHANGLQLYAWEDSQSTNLVKYCVVDGVTGQTIVPATQLATSAIKPRVLVNNGSFLVYWCDTVSFQMKLSVVSAASPDATPVVYTLTSTGANDNSMSTDILVYDATIVQTQAGPQIYVVFGNNNGGATLRSYVYSNPTVQTTGVTQAVIPHSATNISVFGANTIAAGNQGPVVLLSGNAGGSTPFSVYFYAYSFLLAALANATIASGLTYNECRLLTGCNTSSDAVGFTAFFSKTSVYPVSISKAVINSSYAVALTSPWQLSAAPIANAFQVNGTVYLPITYFSPFVAGGTSGDTAQQSCYFIMDASNNVVARAFDDQAANYPGNGPAYPGPLAFRGTGMLASVTAQAVDTMTIPVLEQVLVQGSLQSTTTNVSSLSLRFNDARTALANSELADNLHLSGGCLQMYDGIDVVEHNFHLYPSIGVGTWSGGNPANHLTEGTYYYTACYEWVDNQGNIHQSAPASFKSGVIPGTGVTTGSFPVSISYLQFTAKRSDRPVQLVLYRTVANGTIFYRVTSLTNPDLNVINGALNLTVTDGLSDDDLRLRPQLYTQPLSDAAPTEVENNPAPPTSLVQLHRNRLFLVDSTNPLQLWFSKFPSAGTPVAFNNTWVKQIDPRGGNITALATLDDKLLIFKNNHIFFLLGQGPTNTDQNNDFSDAIMVAADAGCIDARSVALTPAGVMFKGQKGIYLINRSLSVQYIGAPVEAYNQDEVTSAVLVPNTNQVRFTLLSGSVLVYDYFVEQWSVFTNLYGIDSVVWQSSVMLMRTNGTVLRETNGIYDDDGVRIRLKLETSWLSFARLQGFQRVRRMMVLGGWKSPHQLNIGVSFDFNDTVSQLATVNPQTPKAYGESSPYGLGVYGGEFQLYQWRLDLARQKCQAVKFIIEDLPEATASGEGVSLTSLAFEVGAKQGLNKVPASQIVS